MSTEPTAPEPTPEVPEDSAIASEGGSGSRNLPTLALPIAAGIAIVTLVIGLAAGFLIERQRIKSKHHTTVATAPAGTSGRTSAPEGKVTAVSPTGFTIRTSNGQTFNFTLKANTKVLQGSTSAPSNLTVGQTIFSVGASQPDGSYVARRVVIIQQ